MNKLLTLHFILYQVAFCQAQDKLFLNLDQTYESKQPVYDFLKQTPDKFYIIFSAHGRYKDPNNPALNSTAGHAWVVWGRQNPQTLSSENSGFGFMSDYTKIQINTGATKEQAKLITQSTAITAALKNLTIPGKLVTAFLRASGSSAESGVPGALVKELFKQDYSNVTKQVVVEVDESAYRQSLSVISEYQREKPLYEVGDKDCLSFFIEVGESIGFTMPKKGEVSPSTYLPAEYIDMFMKKLSSPNKLGLQYQYKSMVYKNYGTATAKPNGEYEVIFGMTSENKNTCQNDYSRNRVESKIRENKLKCTSTNYPSGEYWYQEYEAAPLSPQYYNVDGVVAPKPISEYWFTNGNSIIYYGQNPAGFNPNYVRMNLSEKNTQYSGTINNKGEPNGLGTLSHFGNVVDGQFQNSIKTGKFIDGKFSDYTGYPMQNGLYYGDFINGQQSGKCRIEFYDGKVFTGTFEKGVATGECSLTNNSTGDYYSGTYKNGLPNGYGTCKNAMGLYKGNFTNGAASGQGASWENSGVVCEGEYENGRLKSGKLTRPDGNYFVGNFDGNGSPTGGTAYDSNGKEKGHESWIGDHQNDWKQGSIQIGNGKEEPVSWGLDVYGKD